MTLSVQPVILAGGYGTRLWPMSRKLLPKQFLALLSQHTLFQYALPAAMSCAARAASGFSTKRSAR